VIYAIGDIHGQSAKLLSLLGKLPLAAADQLVFIGDYVDRGPNTASVLEILVELRSARPNSVFLRGNHEHMMLLARSRFDRDWPAALPQASFDVATLWFAEGGAATIGSYKDHYGGPEARWWQMIPEEHWQFILETKFEHVTGHYHFVHAGLLPPTYTWEEDLLQSDPRLWIREPFLQATCDFGGKVVVFGHTVQRGGKPLIRRNKIGIDTGAAYGGPLTAVALEDGGAPVSIYQS
jgi:serine/threonine protein phosphatase 1